jgi:hypothetical protein
MDCRWLALKSSETAVIPDIRIRCRDGMAAITEPSQKETSLRARLIVDEANEGTPLTGKRKIGRGIFGVSISPP